MKYEGAGGAEEDGSRSNPDSLSLINSNRKEGPEKNTKQQKVETINTR